MRLFVRQQNTQGSREPGGGEIQIDQRQPLGRGATATVYGVKSAELKGKVAKIYHDRRQFDQAKIQAMLSSPPPLQYAIENGQRFDPFAWPSHIVYEDDATPVGYLMPRIDDSQSLPLNFFFERLLARSKLDANDQSLTARIRIARNVSTLLAELHAQGHYVIDFKPQNTKVSTKGLFVSILDCDSFSIQGSSVRRYPATNYTSEYIAPEALRSGVRPQDLLENQDRFALAVVLFQLLNNGIHPFQGILRTDIDLPTTDDRVRSGYYPYGLVANVAVKPCIQSIHECFDERLRRLFDRAFTGRPDERPSASEWSEHFRRTLKERRLERCLTHPSDPTHIRFEGKPCGLCHFDGVLGRPPAVQPSASMPEMASFAGQKSCVLCGRATPSNLLVCPACGSRRFKAPGVSPSLVSNWRKWILAAVVLGTVGLVVIAAQIARRAAPSPIRQERPYEPPKPAPPSPNTTHPSAPTPSPAPHPSAPPTQPTVKSQVYQDWTSSTATYPGASVPAYCYARTFSTKTVEGADNRGRRLVVMIPPGLHQSVRVFGPYTDGSGTVLEIAGRRFVLGTRDGVASVISSDIPQVIRLMRDEVEATVTGSTVAGGTTTDVYSLFGFTDSYVAAGGACKEPTY